ncbi:MAG: hypothetical protein BWK80_04905 [Desulfobacteraceae bacterium IS3]|nr:MAG: hypothetical protein BWK80_04905 [Desulfobacteraceae bacterium IS3]
MTDIRYPGLKLTDDMTLHVFELPKFRNMSENGHFGDDLSEWLHFFNYAHKEDKTMRAAYKNPAIHKAFDVLETLSADEKNRRLAQMREDALRNERSELLYAEKKGLEKGLEQGLEKGLEQGLEKGLEKGRKEGEHEKAVKTAGNLLSMGVLTIEQIAFESEFVQATGLSIKEIQKLQRKKKTG